MNTNILVLTKNANRSDRRVTVARSLANPVAAYAWLRDRPPGVVTCVFCCSQSPHRTGLPADRRAANFAYFAPRSRPLNPAPVAAMLARSTPLALY